MTARLTRAITRRLIWLTARMETLEERFNIVSEQQDHLDRDISEIDAKFSDAIQHLKDQIAQGVPAEQLDFSKADSLLAKATAEDEADTPAAPAAPVDQPASDPAQPAS
jgi:hypothetical protein